ncbi:HNH endonuclease signature motif containing protein [Glutamicibacter sp.]|uniref:HNH endonuclease signature motif containing protein n=1 Tax=Glutamicibacter sp. TaxID=1931995 RepID=UPI002B4840B3|nr:DUF222 domain-containing protein [Glutamicibacter sp.]HJX78027.1 DUF222 domain-containing protein [Glutamicibacter sp.]
MSIQHAFTNDDDEHRLPLNPPGTRSISHLDGPLTSAIEHDNEFAQVLDLASTLFHGPPRSDPSQGLIELQAIASLRRALDAAEAIILTDSIELVAHAAAEYAADTASTAVTGETEQQRNQRISAHYYGVDPASDQIITSSFVAEAAVALRETVEKTRSKLFTAKGLRYLCPDTLNALSRGEITTKAAQEMVKQTQDLAPEDIRRMEHSLLPVAKTASDASFSQRARRLHRKLDPVSAAERHETAAESRCLTHWNEPDGMAALKLYAPAADIHAIVNTVKSFARQDVDPDDSRTQAQREADILRDALLDGWPAGGGTPLKPRVVVTIPAVEALANPKRGLAELEGYGPIPLGVALNLAKDAPSMLRVLTDPWTGAVIDVGRRQYRPAKALKDLLMVRDQCCRFPGCRRTAQSCEVDHIDDFAKGGHTNRSNSQLLCKRHQMFKHALGWKPASRPDGSVGWRTPHGLNYVSLPGSVENVGSFEHIHDRTPVLEVGLTDQVRRVLGWPDPPDRVAS